MLRSQSIKFPRAISYKISMITSLKLTSLSKVACTVPDLLRNWSLWSGFGTDFLTTGKPTTFGDSFVLWLNVSPSEHVHNNPADAANVVNPFIIVYFPLNLI